MECNTQKIKLKIELKIELADILTCSMYMQSKNIGTAKNLSTENVHYVVR